MIVPFFSTFFFVLFVLSVFPTFLGEQVQIQNLDEVEIGEVEMANSKTIGRKRKCPKSTFYRWRAFEEAG